MCFHRPDLDKSVNLLSYRPDRGLFIDLYIDKMEEDANGQYQRKNETSGYHKTSSVVKYSKTT